MSSRGGPPRARGRPCIPTEPLGAILLLTILALCGSRVAALRSRVVVASGRAASTTTAARRQKALAGICRDVEALTLHAGLQPPSASLEAAAHHVLIGADGAARVVRGIKPPSAPGDLVLGPLAPSLHG